MLDKIKDCLRAKELVVYDSAEKIDTCKSPYVVVYDHGEEALPGTKGMLGRRVFEVVALVPYTSVEDLPKLTATVRASLKSLPMLQFSASSGTGVEETFKARACAMTYYIATRL